MKQHMNKVKEKVVFLNVAKGLLSIVIIIIVTIYTNVINLSDDGYDIQRNEYIDIRNIANGILNITYNSNKSSDKCVVYIINTDKKPETKYKYILEPNKNYIVTLTDGLGKYSIETVSVEDNKVYYGDDIVIDIVNVPKYIYKVSTSDINYAKALGEIESMFGDTNNIDEIALNISEFKYDNEFAYNVRNGNIKTYTPDIKSFLNNKKGICLDAATALTAIFRYKGYEAQLVYGYVQGNNEYHSWVRVLDKGEWVTFDPTLNKDGRVRDTDKYLIKEYH